jgi:hypothetical protein
MLRVFRLSKTRFPLVFVKSVPQMQESLSFFLVQSYYGFKVLMFLIIYIIFKLLRSKQVT